MPRAASPTARPRSCQKGVDAVKSLNDNDAYHALGAVSGLLKTGATGTNVNDVTILLLRAAE